MKSTGAASTDSMQGMVQRGQISLVEPLIWPDGTLVQVQPVPMLEATDEQPEDPQAITRWIAEFNAIPAWEMTAEEESQWMAARNAQRELDVARFAR